MSQLKQAYIIAACRTPVGKAPRGAFARTRPDDLLVHVLQSVLAKVPQLDPARIEDCIIGCAFPEAEQGLNMARMAVRLAGLPESVAGVTVNRYCASGLSAIQIAADRIRTGEADVVLAGGAESMSLVPMMGNKVALNPRIFAADGERALAFGMGITAERVAARWQVSREDQDVYALQSHQRALQARAAGRFAAEIAPLMVVEPVADEVRGELRELRYLVEHDEGPRADTRLDKLATLRPSFAAHGSVTAGNSSQMSDGAAALLIVSEAVLKELNIEPLARYAGFAVRGVDPALMGIGPVAALPQLEKLSGVAQADWRWIELNEAFAAQTLAVQREMQLDPQRVNPHGGAIALGHPLGATGAIRACTLIHGMRGYQQSGYGVVTMCVGAGMGAAGLFEVFA